MNIRDYLIETLSPLSLDIRYQGSISTDEPIPETLITYEIIDSMDLSFYDNVPHRLTTNIQLMIYSTKMSVIQSLPDQISLLIKQAGFIRTSKGYDQGFVGNHYAWHMELYFTERIPTYV